MVSHRYSKILLSVSWFFTAMITPTLLPANEKNNHKTECLSCHQVDSYRIGPSFRDIANKYRTTEDADVLLGYKIRNGGAGVWGPIPMPPNDQLDEVAINGLVTWILALPEDPETKEDDFPTTLDELEFAD